METLELPEEDKPPVLYDGEWGIALDPIKWSRAWSRVDLGYTEKFHIPLVTSVSFKPCEGVLGYSPEIHKAN